MITDAFVNDLLAAAAWGGACFCLGVTYAIYRAVGWVDRMRSWAASAAEVSE